MLQQAHEAHDISHHICVHRDHLGQLPAMLGLTAEPTGILYAVAKIVAISPQTYNCRFQEIPGHQLARSRFCAYPAILLKYPMQVQIGTLPHRPL
jgi:hypothetical protein